MTRAHILHVEDDATYAYALSRALEDEDWEITHVFTAEQARRVLAERTPDLMLVDLMLPPNVNREGLDLCLELRRTSPRLPLLILTNREDEDILAEVDRYGLPRADKGQDVEDVGARIRELLGAPP